MSRASRYTAERDPHTWILRTHGASARADPVACALAEVPADRREVRDERWRRPGQSPPHLLPSTPQSEAAACDREANGAVIKGHSKEVQYCYEQRLQARPDLAGRLAVTFTIGAEGVAGEVKVALSTLGDREVEDSVVGRVSKWRFPKPRRGVCVINYPWLFRVAEHAEAKPGRWGLLERTT